MIKKEINTFFATPIGFLTIGLFLLFNSLFLFFFKTEFNILQAGFADLNSFFYLTPWVFLFFIPAITMRSFSEEIQNGTIEILKTKPLTNWQIVWSKFIGAMTIVTLALLPTIVYFFTVYFLGNPVGNIDLASTFGSYLGLFFLASVFVAIGIFCSILTNNQIVSFLLTICLLFVVYFLLKLTNANTYFNNFSIEKLGLHHHYTNMSKGLIDTRNIIYFVSLTFLFLFFAKLKLEKI